MRSISHRNATRDNRKKDSPCCRGSRQAARETQGRTDGQTDRQGQTGTDTDRQTQTDTDRLTQTDRHSQTDTYRQTDRGRQTNRGRQKQTDSQTDRQTDRQGQKRTNTVQQWSRAWTSATRNSDDEVLPTDQKRKRSRRNKEKTTDAASHCAERHLISDTVETVVKLHETTTDYSEAARGVQKQSHPHEDLQLEI